MKIRLGELKKIIKEILEEETWMPGKYYPGAEPLSGEDRDRLNQPLGEEDEQLPGETRNKRNRQKTVEVDTDPSNNPGRPADAKSYIGMKPAATLALAHPALSGE